MHLTSADTLGQDHHWQAEHVLLALPPRLAVAQLAGVPNDVITRAREHLSRLETTALPHETVVASPAKASRKPAAPHQSDMFASLPHPVLDELAKLDLDGLTPRKALEMLYALQVRI